jgi:hypothetical protein
MFASIDDLFASIVAALQDFITTSLIPLIEEFLGGILGGLWPLG